MNTYYTAEDQILLPNSKVQVAVKSFTDTRKQVVYFKFGQRMNATMLGDIVGALEDIGLRHVLVVTDMDTSNVKVWTTMGISHEMPYCYTPNNNRLYFMADSPHLIKLARNHFLDGGYLVNDLVADKECVEVLMETQKGCDLRLAPRLRGKRSARRLNYCRTL